MFVFNLSTGITPYSQRKSPFVHRQIGQYGENVINWTNVCNVHALCNIFEYAKWRLPTSEKFGRSPDAFAEFVVKQCLKEDNWWKRKMPVLWRDWYEGKKDAYSPLELHEVLAHYMNEWLGCSNADTFKTNLSFKDFIQQLYENRLSIATSVAWGALIGHIIAIVGFEAISESAVKEYLRGEIRPEEAITSLIVDDPYGYFNYKTGKYEPTQSGNDIVYPVSYIWNRIKDLNQTNKKYGHIISHPASFV